MVKRGPPSTAELNVVAIDPTRSRRWLTAPSMLTMPEKTLFNDIVASNPHLKPGDVPLLAAYCVALVKAHKLARKMDTASAKIWEMTMRVAISLGTKLRLTAQAQTYPKTSGRARANLTEPSYYETMSANDDD